MHHIANHTRHQTTVCATWSGARRAVVTVATRAANNRSNGYGAVQHGIARGVAQTMPLAGNGVPVATGETVPAAAFNVVDLPT
jgi:hypothetical protein